MPAPGSSTHFLDAGRFSSVVQCIADLVGPCRLYKITVGTTRKIGLTVNWQGNADVGVYTYSAGRTITGILSCDTKGDGPAGQPESCAATFAPGTYYLAVVSFAAVFSLPAGDPTDIRLRLIGLPNPRPTDLQGASSVALNALDEHRASSE